MDNPMNELGLRDISAADQEKKTCGCGGKGHGGGHGHGGGGCGCGRRKQPEQAK